MRAIRDRAEAMAEFDAAEDRRAGWRWCREAPIEDLRAEASRHGMVDVEERTRHALANWIMAATS